MSLMLYKRAVIARDAIVMEQSDIIHNVILQDAANGLFEGKYLVKRFPSQIVACILDYFPEIKWNITQLETTYQLHFSWDNTEPT